MTQVGTAEIDPVSTRKPLWLSQEPHLSRDHHGTFRDNSSSSCWSWLPPFSCYHHLPPLGRSFFLKRPEASNLESEEGGREPHPLSQLYFPSELNKPQTVSPQQYTLRNTILVTVPVPHWHIHPKKHHPVSPQHTHSK